MERRRAKVALWLALWRSLKARFVAALVLAFAMGEVSSRASVCSFVDWLSAWFWSVCL